MADRPVPIDMISGQRPDMRGLCRPEIGEIEQLSPRKVFPVGPINLKTPIEDVVSDHRPFPIVFRLHAPP
ncbi:MAG: hypothetical protein ACJAVR_003453 [Paracoccaceae bacterium]|jgi:hypothetical protein